MRTSAALKKKKTVRNEGYILIEIKNNLQGNNSKVDEAKNQINDLEHKKEKNIESEQQEEKKSPPKRG